eukprot:Awhi_evm3s12155
MDKKRVITLFSGIGCQEMGLDNLGIDYEVVNWCEFDKKVSECYKTIHNVDDSKNIDLLTCSFPCCSFSNQGKMEGFDCDKNGNLFDTSFKLIEKVKPKVVLFENVKGIKNPKFKGDIYVKDCMSSIGYKCFDKVLNSVDYGVPQNRERWFCVCVLDNNIDFKFPDKIPLNKFVKDIIDYEDVNRCIPGRLKPYINVFDGYMEKVFKGGFSVNRVLSIEGTCPTLTTTQEMTVINKVTGNGIVVPFKDK